MNGVENDVCKFQVAASHRLGVHRTDRHTYASVHTYTHIYFCFILMF